MLENPAPQAAATARTLALFDGQLHLQLLPAAPYSAADPVARPTLGVALQRQRGVHAIGSDRRRDFDTWPGVLAYTPAGVDVFSESPGGGEYLLARWDTRLDGELKGRLNPAGAARRLEAAGHGAALALGLRLRRLLLQARPDGLALEQGALDFIGLRAPWPDAPAHAPRQPRQPCARALEKIADEFDRPLTLAQLAACEGMSALALLRAFSAATGMTPHAFIVEARLQAARRMLARGGWPLAEIALACGFSHQSHLGSAMRAALGLTPGQYRRLYGTKDEA